MSSDTVHRALLEIRDNIGLARSFVASLDYEAFRIDRKSIYAVTRCLEIISEASRRLPAEMISRYPSVPWRQIAAAGNHYRHEYDNVSPSVLWTTVQESMSGLEGGVPLEIEAIEGPSQ